MRRKASCLFLLFALGGGLAAENIEKTQKKELEIRAKVIIAEAKKLEASGELAEARMKYAESQAMLETKDAADAIKRLDDELRKRVKDKLRETLKLYETQSYKEAIAALDDGMKFQTFQPVLAHNLALCYHHLGERGKAVEYLQRAISGTPDPKQKQRLQQLLTFFITGENGSELDKERVVQVNRLTDIHVSLLSRKNTGAQARSGERALFGCRTAQLAFCLSAVVPAFAEPDIHWLSRARRPSQKIECVFSASPETVRREPWEVHLRRSVGQWQDLAVCALCDPGAFSLAWF